MMFRKCFLVSLFVILRYNDTSGQALTVNAYTNQLFFNVFKEQPDPAIREFLKLYIPSLLDKKTLTRPTAGDNKFNLEAHAYVFLQHPVFKAVFTNGKLEFDCRRYNDARGVQVENIRLWFHFDTQQDGETAFGQLVSTLTPISTAHKIYSANGAMVGEFSDSASKEGFGKVQIYLTSDNTDRTKFHLLYATGNSLP